MKGKKDIHRRQFLFHCVLVSLIAAAASGQQSSDHYALPFGEDPFAPSLASLDVPGFLKASDFPSAQYCGKCHSDIHREWRESAHSNSSREPFYLKDVQMLARQKGIAYTRHCEGCHNPVALLSGALTGKSSIPKGFDEGLTCEVCHSIAKIQLNEGTGSYTMAQPAVMLNPDGSPRPGLPTDDQILANLDLHKKAVMKDFLRTPEFCAVCHKAAIPEKLDGYKWLRAFSVYDEWQQSRWSMQSPLSFYRKQAAVVCQNCHMPLRADQGKYAAIEGKVRSHRFIAANSAIPTFYSYSEQLLKTQQFLKNTVTVDIFGLTIKHNSLLEPIYPLGSSGFKLRTGDELTLDAVIQNVRAGHSLVPEQRDLYESWVECIATDDRGNIVFHSGALSSDGHLDPKAHRYANRLIDAQGNRITHHEIWRARLQTYDNTIMPGSSDLVRFQFRVPKTRAHKLDIVVRVNYRRFRKAYTDFILDEDTRYPVLELGSARIGLQIGANVAKKDNGAGQGQALRRWNNYGIALLGQQQWWAASHAFEQTTRLDPSYTDGFINQAIAELSKWIETNKQGPDGPGIFSLDNANAPPEKFNVALDLLQEALHHSPASARALFYRGVIFRLQNRLDQAIKDFLEVSRQYPKFRQVREELGYAYYLRKDFPSAIRQFESAKAINPDDITACYYLSISYARVGKKREADENAKFYATHRDDPGNYALNLHFLNTSAPESNELTPYHVHTQ